MPNFVSEACSCWKNKFPISTALGLITGTDSVHVSVSFQAGYDELLGYMFAYSTNLYTRYVSYYFEYKFMAQLHINTVR